MRKDTGVEQEHPGIRPTVQETYGPLNLGHQPMFGGGFINFGYWQGIDLAGPLGEDERARSQQALYRHVLDAAGPLRRRQVLDVGCGLGMGCAVALTEYEPDGVTGMDIHPDQLVRAREEQAVLLGEQPDRLRFAEGAAERMPWQDGAFDVVVSVEAMQHFPDLGGFAAETTRVLRPGGTVAVTSFFTADEAPGRPEQLARLLDTYASGLDIARPVTALSEAFTAAGLAEVRAVSIGPEVWRGWDCWLSRWWAPGTWPRNFLRAYEDKILDYFVVTALKPL
ncbi:MULTISPECIES: methyltransferase domain-containing protein [unclassified Streptomyces]|uniref:class I SAM-dependent methyltransferase n=1 Tax=unclassified Streptomyces TaxID=2593676 RepID=UPI0036ED83A3